MIDFETLDMALENKGPNKRAKLLELNVKADDGGDEAAPCN